MQDIGPTANKTLPPPQAAVFYRVKEVTRHMDALLTIDRRRTAEVLRLKKLVEDIDTLCWDHTKSTDDVLALIQAWRDE